MKRIGLIDNLSDIQKFLDNKLHCCTASELMQATGGNTGNVAFVYGIRKLLSNPITRLGWNWDDQIVRERFDQIVICGANQIGEHTDLGVWAERLEKFNLPVTIIGIGAQSDDLTKLPKIPSGTQRFLEITQNLRPTQNPNISTRGNFSSRVLNTLSIPSIPAGCPSLFINSNIRLGQSILERSANKILRKIAVAAGNPWHTISADIEPTLVNIVNNHHGEYVVQHPISMLQILLGEKNNLSKDALKTFLKVYKSDFTEDSIFEWFHSNASFYADAPNWIKSMRKYDAVIGPRYHGVALAIQSGTPGCVLTIDSRTEELSETTGIKFLPINNALKMTPEELIERSIWSEHDCKTLDEARLKNSNQFVTFLEDNNLTPSIQLREIAKQ